MPLRQADNQRYEDWCVYSSLKLAVKYPYAHSKYSCIEAALLKLEQSQVAALDRILRAQIRFL